MSGRGSWQVVLMKKSGTMHAPEHIALIPDGNRRWARSNKVSLLGGYSLGIKKFVEFSTWSKQFGVKTITVWALSTENLKNRTGLELKILFDLYTKAAKDRSIRELLRANNAHLNVIGDMSALPKKLVAALKEIEEETRRYGDFTINLLVNYGGKEDLMYSVRSISSEASEDRGAIGEAEMRDHLRTSSIPDIDLVIRTSGEMRLSGLLPWQSAYSELYFTKKYWPEFNRDDLRKAVQTYSKRQRRFGK